MDQLQNIYDAIAAEGFSAGVLALIDNFASKREESQACLSYPEREQSQRS